VITRPMAPVYYAKLDSRRLSALSRTPMRLGVLISRALARDSRGSLVLGTP
jgi:hypothetical protein